ncbi:MAG: hypothetical protein ACOCU8_02550 [Patescibacteria group bacterium]
MLKYLPVPIIKKVVFGPRHCRIEHMGKLGNKKRIKISLDPDIYNGLDPIWLILSIGSRIRLIDSIGIDQQTIKKVKKILTNYNRQQT